MTAGAFKRVTLYNAETGQQVELNGGQEISIAEEVIEKKLRETMLDFEREVVRLALGMPSGRGEDGEA